MSYIDLKTIIGYQCNNGACHSAAIAKGTNLVPYHVVKSFDSFEDQASSDEIYGCPNFDWVAMTSFNSLAPGRS